MHLAPDPRQPAPWRIILKALSKPANGPVPGVSHSPSRLKAINLRPAPANHPFPIARKTSFCSVLAMVVGIPLAVRANPSGGTVVAGSATVGAPNASTLVVTQSSNRAIIDWSSFSIGAGELTKFIQPTAASALLNRVTGADPSNLLGSLQSNGQIFLINRNGIVVGQGARIDAGGFVASSLDASNAQFLAGGDLLLSGESGAAVANLGSIDASEGNVYLVAQQVANTGSITAAKGTAALAAGTEVTLTQNGIDHVLIGAGAVGASGSGAQVLNSGTIQAAQAELKAENGNLYALAINNTGVVRATGVRQVGGHVFLTADGAVSVSGTLEADGTAAGGQIIISGSSVALAATASVSANGASQGGVVLVGGDRAGGSNPTTDLSPIPVANAGTTTVAAGARISADGAVGNGGQVVVWSDRVTDFEGAISARGGPGHVGGFAEVSSHGVLNFTGTADLTAAGGAMGTLLLDPEDVVISSGTTFNGSISSGSFTPSGDSSILNVTDLETALGTGNVIVTTGSTGAQAGNITLASALTWTPPGAGSSLALTAAGGVFINATLTVPANGGLTVTTGTGGITQSAPITQAAGAGPVSFNAGPNPITLTQSNSFAGVVSLSNSGANDVALVASGALALGTSTVGGNLSLTAGGSITEAGPITANGGTTTLAVTAPASDILLGNQANDFGTSVPVLAGTLADVEDLSLRTTNAGAVLPNLAGLTNLRNVTVAFDNAAVSLPAVTLTNGGSLAVSAGGTITQSGAATVPGTSSFAAGSNAITLTQANDFGGAVLLNNAGANNVAVVNAAALVLGTSSIGQNLALTAGGSITETGPIAANGGTTTLAVTASLANVLLGSQANDFGPSAPVLAGTLSNVEDLSLRNTNSGALLPSLAGLTNLRNFTVDFDNAAVVLPALTLTNGGNLAVTAGGAITQTGADTVPGTASFTAGANAITLTQSNALTGTINLSNSDANNVSVTNSLATNLGSSGLGSGSLTVVSGGAITEAGGVSQAAGAGTATFSAGAHSITLNQGNAFTGTVVLSNNGISGETLNNLGATVLGASNVGSGALTITSAGALTQTGAITQGAAAASEGAVTFNAGANAITLTQANSLLGSVGLVNSGANNVVLDNGATSFGASSLGSGTLTVTATGAISQSGAITQAAGAGTASFTAGAHAITLTQANDFTGAVAFANSGNNNVALTNAAATVLGGSNLGFGTFTLVSSGAVTETGAIIQTNAPGSGANSFTAGANAITLTQANTFVGTVAVTNSGANDVAITNTGPLKFGASSVGSGALTVTAGGAITQSGTITQAAGALSATFSAGANAITLPLANSLTGPVSLTNSGANNVALTNGIATSLGTSSVGTGTLTVTSTGAITQTGTVTQAAGAGAATFAAGTNAITLGQANSLTGAVVLTNSGANNVSLTNAIATKLGASSVGTGTLTVNSSGAITETGAVTQAVGAGTATFSAGANAITLSQANSLKGGVVLNNSGANNVSLTNATATVLAASGVGSGTLTVTSTGAITQTGAVTQAAGAGTATFSAGANPISLTQSNGFTGSVVLTNSGANDAALSNGAPLALGTSSVGQNLTLTAGGTITQTGTLTATGGTTTVSVTASPSDILLGTQANNFGTNAPVFAGTLANIRDFSLRSTNAGAALPSFAGLTNLRNLTLTFNSAAISLPALTLTNGGNLAVTAGGAITQTGADTVPGTASFTAGANAITLTQANDFVGAIALNNSGANNVAVTNAAATVLGASTVGTGTLAVTSGGALTETGAVTQAAAAGTATFNAGGNAIALTQNNDFTGAVALNNSGANNVAVTNAAATSLAASGVGSGTFTVTSTGAITETGAITQAAGAGAATFSDGAHVITLTQANDFTGPVALSNSGNNAVALTNAGPTALGTSSVGSGTFTVTSSGAITETGTVTQAVTALAVTFTAGANAITLAQNNDFTGAVSLNNSGANDVALTNAAVTVLGASNVGSGALTINATGAITQTGAVTQAAGAGPATFSTGAAAITLTQANNLTGSVDLGNSGANNISLTNGTATALGTSSVGTGTLTINSSGAITETGVLTQAAGSNFITLNAGANPITFNQNNSINSAVVLANSGANNTSLTNSLATKFGASSIGSGTLTINSGGAITQTGAVTQAAGAGAATFNTGAAAITLTQTNGFTGSVVLDNSGANNVALTNSGATALGASSVGTGTFTVTATGAITETGAITQAAGAGTATFSAGANAITLTQSNAFTGAVALNNSGVNDAALTNGAALIVGTSAIGHNLTLTAGGGITEAGAITASSGTTTLAVTAPGSDILLGTQANNLGSIAPVFGGTLSDIRDVNLRNINAAAAVPAFAGLTNLRNLTLTFNSAAMALPALTLTSGGSLAVTAGGAITQTGVATVPGTSTFTAGSHAITLTQPNAFTGAVSLNNGAGNNVALTNAQATALGTSSLGSGTLTVFSSGAVTEAGAVTQAAAAGAVAIAAGANPITLDQANGFTGAVGFNNSGANNILLNNLGATSLALSNVGTGTFTVTSNAAIVETGGINQTVGAGAVTFSTGAGALTLNHDNHYYGTLFLTNSGANNVILANDVPTSLGTLSLGSGTLTVNSVGAITQSGAISEAAGAGLTTFNAGANPITLTLANALSGPVALTNSGTNNVALTNGEATTLAISNLGSGTLTVTSSGAIAETGAITQAAGAGAATFNAGANAITLTQNNTLTGAVSLDNNGAGNVAVTNAAAIALGTSSLGSGTLTITAAGAITETGAVTQAAGAGTASFSAGAHAIALGQANDLTGALVLANSGNNNVAVVNAGATTLGTSSVGSGTFAITSSGPITQTGTITQAAAASATTFTAGANPISLGLNNGFTGIVTLSNSGANDAALNNAGALLLGSSTVGGNLSVSAAGALTVFGANATNVSLTATGTGDSINLLGSLTAANAITANAAAGDIMVKGGTSMTAHGTGTAITLMAGSASPAGTVAGGNFINNAGAAALSTPTAGAHWLVYTGALPNSGTLLGGLAVPAWRYDTDATYVPGAGTNEVLYRAAPALTLAATPQSSTYGMTPSLASGGYTVSGEVSGNGASVDVQTAALGGAPSLSTAATATSSVLGGPYAITLGNGTITNPYNYGLTFNNGALTVNPAALTITASAVSKSYGQTNVPSGTDFAATGLQNGEMVGSVTLLSAGAAGTASVAGSPYVITVSNAAGGTFNPSNYTITYDPGLLTVNAAALTITANNASKGYGQTISFTGAEFTATGLQNGETVGTATLGSTGTPATANVAGSPYAITVSNAIGGTFTPSNYAITYDPGLLTVNPAALTITANRVSKSYGQTIAFTGAEYTATGLQNGETVGTATLASAGAPATAGVAGSPYAITASNATGGSFNPGNYTVTYDPGLLTVNPAALTITANNASKSYGQTITFTGTEFTSAGLQNGETVGTAALGSVGAPATAGVVGSPYAITASNATGGSFNPGNYTITYDPGVLTINPAALTITANNVSKSYGQTISFTGAEFTASGLQNSETVGSATLTSAGAAGSAGVAGSPYAITASNAGGGTFNPDNYTITYDPGFLTVNPAALTITANSVSKSYGQTISFTGAEFTATGLQNGETVGAAMLASAGAPATVNVAGSPYAITVSNAAGGTFNPGNYTITYDPGLLTVNPAALTITANSVSKSYGQTISFTGAEFTATGLQNGETVGTATLASTATPPTANVAGSPYVITVSNAAGGTFNPSNYAIAYDPGLLTVNPAALTITANNASKIYGQTFTFSGTEFAVAGLQNGETVGTATLGSVGAPAMAGVDGSPYAITASNATGGTFNPGNYSITYDPGLLTINPAALTITANNVSKGYGQTHVPSGTDFTASGLQNGETVGAVTLTSAGAVGTASVAGSPYIITASNAVSGTFDPTNYSITYDPGLLTVNPAALTITANNLSKTYGQVITFTGTGFTATGLQNGETVGTATLASAGAPATAGVVGSPYAITVSNAAGGTFNPNNYALSYDPGLLTVNPMQVNLTVTAESLSKTYGQAVTFSGTEFTGAGLQNGDTIGSVTLTSAGAPRTANVGTYPIYASNATGGTFNPSDYIITYDPGVLTVNPAALTIMANNLTKTYGQTVAFFGTEFTSSGLENGETIGQVALASGGAGPRESVSASPYPIMASGATGGSFNPSNYTIAYAPGALTIDPAILTVGLVGTVTKIYDGTSAAALSGGNYTLAGVLNGDSVSLNDPAAGTYASKNVGSGIGITVSGLELSGAQSGDYLLAAGTIHGAIGAVTPATLTYVSNPATLSVGAPIPGLGGFGRGICRWRHARGFDHGHRRIHD